MLYAYHIACYIVHTHIVYTYIHNKASKSTDYGMNIKWSMYGGGRFRELEYRYKDIVWTIGLDPNKAIDIGEWSVVNLWRWSVRGFTVCICSKISLSRPRIGQT